jgi:hypothetical protein
MHNVEFRPGLEAGESPLEGIAPGMSVRAHNVRGAGNVQQLASL